MHTLGIDIGGTFIKYAWVNSAYEIVKEWEVETKLQTSSELFYDYLIESAGDLSSVDIIGVSAPGVLASDSTVTSIAAPNVAIMYNTNVNKEVMKRANKQCYTMNDAKAAGYCELKLGAARNTGSSMVFIIGTGIGGALTLGDHVLEGIDGYAGEFSRIPMKNSKGEFSIAAHEASASTLPFMYNQLHPDSVTSAKDVFTLFHQGDADAITVMNQWVDNIVFILCILISIYNPDVICIGGGVTKDPGLIDHINTVFDGLGREMLFAQPALTTKLVACEYSSNSNLMGAVLFALESTK